MAKQVYNQNETVDKALFRRLNYIFDNFENIQVSISGGKDSTVLCWAALQVAKERNRKIGIFFLDEEVVYDSTIEQVRWLMNLYPENTIKQWVQIPFNLTNSTSLSEGYLRCWEEGKSKIWMRHKEPDSIKAKPWDEKFETIRCKAVGLDYYALIDNWERIHPNTAFLVGLRATESPNRYRAVVKNPGFKDCFWSTKRENGSASFYPMFDWNFHDVWKFIYDNKIRYSKIYDYQYKKGMGMQEIRVSSLIHEKSFKALVELPEFEPKTFDRLLKRCKGIQFGNLYGKDKLMMKCRKLPKNYKTWIEYKDFLLKTYPDEDKKWIFEKRFSAQLNNNYVARQQCRQLILNDYENNLPIKNIEDPRDAEIRKWRELLL